MLNFFHAAEPLRDSYLRRALMNMPRINLAEYRPSDSVISTHDLELLSPFASPNLPSSFMNEAVDTNTAARPPPAPPATAAKIKKEEENMESEEEDSEDEEEEEEEREQREVRRKVKKEIKQEDEEEYSVTHLEDQPLYSKVPRTSSTDKVKQLRRDWERDPNLCRECADTFCRYEHGGDRYLISCSGCRDKYHSFCAVDYRRGQEFLCPSCSPAEKVPKLIPVSGSDLHCQLCRQSKSGSFEGRWIGPIGNVPGADPTYVHENCAFYSKGVVKINDQWCGIQSAIRYSHSARCAFCDQKGASIPCDCAKCRKLFHYACVKKQFCSVIEHADKPQKLYCANHYENALKTMYETSDTSSAASSTNASPVSPTLLSAQQQHHKKMSDNVIQAASLKLEDTVTSSSFSSSPKLTPRKRHIEEMSEEEDEDDDEDDKDDDDEEEAQAIKLPRLSRDHNFPSVSRLAEWDDRYHAVREEGYRKRIQKWESKIRCTYRKLKDITGLSPQVMKELGKIATEMENRFPALTVDNTVRLKAGAASI